MATSLYDEYKSSQPDTTVAAPASLYDEYKATTPKPLNTDSLRTAEGRPVALPPQTDAQKDSEWAQARRGDTPAQAKEYAGLTRQQVLDKPIETDAVGGDRMAAFDADTKARLGQLIPSLAGLVHGVVDPFVTLAKEGAYQVAGNSPLLGKLFPRPSGTDVARAAPQALVGAIAPGASQEVEALASPLARGALRPALGAGMGAVYDPTNPVRGATIGAIAGGAHAAVADAPAALSGARAAAGRALFPDLAAQAEQARIAQASESGTRATLQQAQEYYRRRDDPTIKRGPKLGPQVSPEQLTHESALGAVGTSFYNDYVQSPEYAQYMAARGQPVAEPSAATQIPPDEGHGTAGDLPARTPELDTPEAGGSPNTLPARGLAAETATPSAPDPTVQPSLHDQAVSASGGLGQAGSVDGAGAPEGVEYRNAGLSLPQKAGDVVKGALDRAYPELEHAPEDLPVRDALLAAGAGKSHGLNVARYGMAHVRAGIDPATVSKIEAQVFADNFEMQAASRDAAGDHTAAANLRAHAELARSESTPGIENTQEYQQYVGRYRDVMEPEYNRVAKSSGLADDKFRAVKPGSVYVPLPADIEAEAPTNVVRSTGRRLGTKQSSAVKVATGGAGSYVMDAQHAAETFLPERARVAGENELWQAVRDRGREMTGRDEQLQEGEAKIAFTDKNQITTPESEDATHFVAVPERVADGVRQYIQRSAPNAPAGTVGKAIAGTKRLLTKGAVAINPAITLTHGGNIASTLNMLPGRGLADVARTAASAVPFGNTLGGLAEMVGADLSDGPNTKALLGVSRYGGLRPLDADPEALGLKNAQHKTLFGQTGADPRARALAIQRYRQSNPEATDADAALFLTKNFGNYVTANQPDLVFRGQRSGATTFAPAGFAFTSSAVKRLAGQSGMDGIGNTARTLTKSVVAPVAGLVAANYALSGHSPLSNEEGHRGDIDLGSQDDEGRERYLKSSYAYPLLNRAANTTGIRPLVEGEGATGAYAGAANEVLSQVGVVPRMGFSLLNQQLRLNSQDATPEAVTEPQFGDGNRFLKIAQRSLGGAMGAPAGIAGSTNFSANRPLKDRTLDAFHLNPIAKGRAGGQVEGSNALYNALDAKMTAAYRDVARAQTDEDKQAVIQQTLERAKSDGYPDDALEMIEAQLQKAAEKSPQDRGDARGAAMSKKGLGAP